MTLEGRIREPHRFLPGLLRSQGRFSEEEIAALNRRRGEQTAEQQEVLDRWDGIPGGNRVIAVAGAEYDKAGVIVSHASPG